MERLYKNDCEEKVGHTYHDILSLSGVFGIHPVQKVLDEEDVYVHLHHDGLLVIVDITSDLIATLHVYLNLYEKAIYNDEFESTDKEKGIAFKRLDSQVGYARAHKFRYLGLHAAGDCNDQKYIGYIIWGKYGFLMSDEHERNRFLKQMKAAKRNDKILYTLLNNKEGLQYWTDTGFEWMGKFNLSTSSKSSKIFHEVKTLKELAL